MNIETLRLHIGIHKTGSSSLQKILYDNEDKINTEGTYVLRQRPYREAFKHANSIGEITGAQAASAMNLRLSEIIPKSAKTVILSEENILGPMNSNLTSTLFYGRAENRLILCREAMKAKNVEVYFGLREYGSYYNSVYAYSAMRQELNDFFLYKKRILSQENRAQSLVAMIESVFGAVPMRVWFQETMRGHEVELVQAMTGHALKNVKFEGELNRGPSIEAAEILQNRYRNDDQKVGPNYIESAMKDYPLGAHDAPEYWSEQERAQLRADYLADIEALKTKKNVAFLTDEPKFEGA